MRKNCLAGSVIAMCLLPGAMLNAFLEVSGAAHKEKCNSNDLCCDEGPRVEALRDFWRLPIESD